MVTKTNEFDFITTDESLTVYLSNLPPNIQIRYPAFTSLDGLRGVVSIVPHKERKDYFLTVPYDLLKAYLTSKRVTGYTRETVRTITAKGLLKETFLRLVDMTLLGTIPVSNTLPGATEDHVKSTVLVTKYFRRDEKEPYDYPLKTGTPVWMHKDLLGQIFKKVVEVNGEKKYHPHARQYKQYLDYLDLKQIEESFG
ncbi:MAG TPA: hypothetical protein VGE18_00425 [Candidatus Paceibacterota bacterium]